MSENHPSDDYTGDRAPDGRDGHEPLYDPGPGPEPGPGPQEEAGSDPVLHLHSPARGRRLARPEQAAGPAFSYQQRLLLLDTWRRSGLPAGDFAPLVGLSKHTLYDWKRRFEADGPAGLAHRPKGAPQGARLALS